MNRTIVKKVRCLLIDSCLGKRFWAEAVNTAVYLINRTPCKGLKELVPVEAWPGKKPNLSHLEVFGCSAITHIPKQKRKKFDSKGNEVTFVGYTYHNQTYRFYDHQKTSFLKVEEQYLWKINSTKSLNRLQALLFQYRFIILKTKWLNKQLKNRFNKPNWKQCL